MILVTGATGLQGGATVRALQRAGRKLRAMTRNLPSAHASVLGRANIELVYGDFDDHASLDAALDGTDAVFSVQLSDSDGSDVQSRRGQALVAAARRAGIRHFIHSSVSGTAQYRSFPGWDAGRWDRSYWIGKSQVEEAVRQAGFPVYTILKPAFIMENFVPPRVDVMFPSLRHGELVTVMEAHTRLALVAAGDIAAFVVAALASPERFGRQEIDLAGDVQTVGAVTAVLGRVKDAPIRLRTVSPDELVELGYRPSWVLSQTWTNEFGYPASPDTCGAYGVPLTSFEAWAERARDQIPGT